MAEYEWDRQKQTQKNESRRTIFSSFSLFWQTQFIGIFVASMYIKSMTKKTLKIEWNSDENWKISFQMIHNRNVCNS